MVQFATGNGYLANETGCDILTLNGQSYNFSIAITRTGDMSGTFTPIVTILNTNVNYGDGLYWLPTDAFQAGQPTTWAYFNYNPGDYSTVNPYVDFAIGNSASYIGGSPATYHLDLNLPPGPG